MGMKGFEYNAAPNNVPKGAAVLTAKGGKWFWIDADVEAEVRAYVWRWDGRYLFRMEGDTKIFLHDVVMKPTSSEKVSFKSYNHVDVRRANLIIKPA